MQDILIHHCALRIVRRGGWSWGSEPQKLLNGVIRTLPELLARELGRLWPDDDEERDFSAPLRICIPVRMKEFLQASEINFIESSNNGGKGLIERYVEQAVKRLVEQTCGRSAVAQDANSNAETAESEQSAPESPLETSWAGSVLRVLLEWHRQNALPSRLVLFSPAALEAWHDHIFYSEGEIAEPDDRKPETELAAIARQILAELIPVPLGRQKSLIQRILIAISAVATIKIFPADPVIRKLLDNFVPISAPEAVNLSTENHSASITNQKNTVPFHAPPEIHQVLPRRKPVFDVHVLSALPFLLLGPLSRVGYLDAVAATLQAAHLTSEFGAFATALAYKVLDPPERGWLRRPETRAAAAAFAGVTEPIPDPEMVELSRKLLPHLSPLNTFMSGTLVDAHRRGEPLSLLRADVGEERGFLLVDSDGIFPITWVADLPHLFHHLAGIGCALLVPHSSASVDVLGQLNDAGVLFITDASPARGEKWQRITNPVGGVFWTNLKEGSTSEVIKAARKLEYAADESELLWNALAVTRRAFPVGCSTALETSFAIAASLALGTIAWTLWKDREPVTPLLALERFKDLDAHVRFNEHSVKIRLPIGKRYQDLYEHGLLADISDVPWFGGRVLQFSGG